MKKQLEIVEQITIKEVNLKKGKDILSEEVKKDLRTQIDTLKWIISDE